MARKLEVGDTVQCRYYNSVDKKFYGATFVAEIVKIQPEYEEIKYVVRRIWDGYIVALHRKELIRRVE